MNFLHFYSISTSKMVFGWFLVTMTISGGTISVLAFAVITMAIFTLCTSITVLLAMSMFAISPTMHMTLFTFTVMAITIGSFDYTSGALCMMPMPVPMPITTIGLGRFDVSHKN